MMAAVNPRFWDRIARKYAAMPIKNPDAYARTMERTRSWLSPTDRVLEIGCGTGSTALLLSSDVAHVTASDVSPGMLAIGREKAVTEGTGNVRFVEAEVTELPADGPYDAVLAFSILHLVPDLPRGLAEVRARLKPGGLLISKTPCLSGLFGFMRLPIGIMRLLGRAPWVGFLSVERLERTIREAGFEIVESDDHAVRPPRRFIVARKL